MNKVRIKYMAIGGIIGGLLGAGSSFTIMKAVSSNEQTLYPFTKNTIKAYAVTTDKFVKEGDRISKERSKKYLSKGEISQIDGLVKLNIYDKNILNKENKDIATYIYNDVNISEMNEIIKSFESSEYEPIIIGSDKEEVQYNQDIDSNIESKLVLKNIDYNDYTTVLMEDEINNFLNDLFISATLTCAALGTYVGYDIGKTKKKTK